MRMQLLALVLPAAVAAQVTVDGDVVRKGTGEPLAGVRVVVCAETPRLATDATGHFHFTSLAQKSCALSLNGPGWMPRTQMITSTPEVGHIALRVEMTPQAVIAGKITDENGWPIIGGQVSAARYVTDHGVRRLEPFRGER